MELIYSLKEREIVTELDEEMSPNKYQEKVLGETRFRKASRKNVLDIG